MVGPSSLQAVRLRAFSTPILVARRCRLRAAAIHKSQNFPFSPMEVSDYKPAGAVNLGAAARRAWG